MKSAKAGTDVPSRVPEFISQRRRWLNGSVRVNLVILESGIDDRSIFAAVYAMVCFWRIWTSGHGFIRKIMLNLITIYSMLSLMSRRHNWSWWLMNRFDQSTVQLVIRLFFLPCLLFPYRFLDFYGVGPVRRGRCRYFRGIQ